MRIKKAQHGVSHGSLLLATAVLFGVAMLVRPPPALLPYWDFGAVLGGIDGKPGSGRDPCEGQILTREPQPTKAPLLVLVTGGAGFIGSHLVELLLKLGYRVRVLDNLSTGDPAFLDGSNADLQFMYGDVRRYEDCLQALEGGVVGVFHLAGVTGAIPSATDLERAGLYQAVNVEGTHNLLKAALATGGVRKVVYASSSSVYGNNPVPQKESMAPDPQTPYASSKVVGELLMRQFNTLKLPTISIRLFSVYGNRQPSEGMRASVLGCFVSSLRKGEPLVINARGEQSRDFMHVSDAARALVMAFQSEVHDGAINAGTGSSITISRLAELVSAKVQHSNAPPGPGSMQSTLADTCLAKRVLRYQARTELAQGIKAEVASTNAGGWPSERYRQPVIDAEMVISVGRKEDLSWAKNASLPLMRQFVYNKTDFSDASIPLHLGGETTAYIYHIIKHYHELPAVIIFTQGDPLHHVGGPTRLSCLVRHALDTRPDYEGFSLVNWVERDFHSFSPYHKERILKYVDKMLAALNVTRREPNPVNMNGIFATTRSAVHSHSRDWWMLLWEYLTNDYKYPASVGNGGGVGGGHLVERYWHQLLDPQDKWICRHVVIAREMDCKGKDQSPLCPKRDYA